MSFCRGARGVLARMGIRKLHGTPVVGKTTLGQTNLARTCCKSTHARSLSSKSWMRSVLLDNRFAAGSFEGKYRLLSTQATGSEDNSSLTKISPQNFIEYLKKNEINRCFVVFDKEKGCAVASHPELQELADFFNTDDTDYLNHEGVFMQLGQRTGCLLGAFIWRTNRGQACGGIRLWQYSNMEKYLRDGLRLAFGMGVKSALAGLWAGGGKGVVSEPPDNKHEDAQFRQKIFHDYGDFLTSLNGSYVAAEDVGLIVEDLDNVHSRTRYTTCISESLGGSGNPSIATGKGVVCAMEGALDFLKMGTLEMKSVAIQGAGNVAVVVIEELLKRRVGHIHVTDCQQKRVEDVSDRFSSALSSKQMTIEKVALDDTSVLSRKCDILSPCALGNVLTEDTIPGMEAKIVCGAANNQLGREEDNLLMAERGITYVPDFLANRMGIVNCANETYGRLPDDPAISRHFGRTWENSIFLLTRQVLSKAQAEGITPTKAAMEVAERMSREPHPIWPDRSQSIITSLVHNQWHHGNDFWSK